MAASAPMKLIYVAEGNIKRILLILKKRKKNFQAKNKCF